MGLVGPHPDTCAVVLSKAKDLHFAGRDVQVLRFAQDDKGPSPVVSGWTLASSVRSQYHDQRVLGPTDHERTPIDQAS